MSLRAAFRVDAGLEIGGGHLMRCLTLADALREKGGQVSFFIRDREGNRADLVLQRGYDLFLLPRLEKPFEAELGDPDHAPWLGCSQDQDAADVLVQLDQSPDWLIIDHYGIDHRWVAALGLSKTTRTLNIDDLDDRDLGCQIVLDQAYLHDKPRRHPSPINLLGPKYALIRPEFSELRETSLARRLANPGLDRVLVCPGTVDPTQIALMAIEALDAFPELKVDFAIGSACRHLPEIQKACLNQPSWTLYTDTQDMPSLMAQADLAIGAGGMTTWERCTLGLPTLYAQAADNQGGIVSHLNARGAGHEFEDQSDLRNLLEKARELLREWAETTSAICQGRGVSRVLALMTSKLRPITPGDSRRLFEWRNSPAIRKVSQSSDELVFERHDAWLRSSLAKGDSWHALYLENDRPLGAIRFDPIGDAWRWSFYLGENAAVEGAGSRMCAQGLAAFQDSKGGDALKIRAEVLPDNQASIALHKRLGFVSGQAPNSYVLTLPNCERS